MLLAPRALCRHAGFARSNRVSGFLFLYICANAFHHGLGCYPCFSFIEPGLGIRVRLEDWCTMISVRRLGVRSELGVAGARMPFITAWVAIGVYASSSPG